MGQRPRDSYRYEPITCGSALDLANSSTRSIFSDVRSFPTFPWYHCGFPVTFRPLVLFDIDATLVRRAVPCYRKSFSPGGIACRRGLFRTFQIESARWKLAPHLPSLVRNRWRSRRTPASLPGYARGGTAPGGRRNGASLNSAGALVPSPKLRYSAATPLSQWQRQRMPSEHIRDTKQVRPQLMAKAKFRMVSRAGLKPDAPV